MKKLMLMLALLALVGCAHRPTPDEICATRFGPNGEDYWKCMNMIYTDQQMYMQSLSNSGVGAVGAWQGGAAAREAFRPRPAPVWIGR